MYFPIRKERGLRHAFLLLIKQELSGDFSGILLELTWRGPILRIRKKLASWVSKDHPKGNVKNL